MTPAAKLKPESLEAVQLELAILVNGLEYSPQIWALRLAINRVLDAYHREAAKAFGVGILIGAGGMVLVLAANGAWGY